MWRCIYNCWVETTLHQILALTLPQLTSAAMLGRDVVIMVARRRFLPPSMDMFHDVIIVFELVVKDSTDALLRHPRAIYNSLTPLSVFPLDDQRHSTARGRCAPPAGFLYYREKFNVTPGPCSHGHFFNQFN